MNVKIVYMSNVTDLADYSEDNVTYYSWSLILI